MLFSLDFIGSCVMPGNIGYVGYYLKPGNVDIIYTGLLFGASILAIWAILALV